jgi:very-short-patch-repair endonuclease
MTSANATVVKARELRRTMTLPEVLLWRVLRKRPGGYKFRRQHPFGPFILDFYCSALRLAIEVDGEVHSMGDQPARDKRREAYLRTAGIRTLRFDAADIFNRMDAVARMILAAASE